MNFNETYQKCFIFKAVENPDYVKKLQDWKTYDEKYEILARNLSIRNVTMTDMQDTKFRFQVEFFKVYDISAGGKK